MSMLDFWTNALFTEGGGDFSILNLKMKIITKTENSFKKKMIIKITQNQRCTDAK